MKVDLSKISPEDMVDVMGKVVADKGEDYIYDKKETDGCVYFQEDGQPACLLGHMFYMLGFNHEYFEDDRNENSFIHLWRGQHIKVQNELLVDALQAAQVDQDLGHNWGEVFQMFTDVVLNGAKVQDFHLQEDTFAFSPKEEELANS